MRCTKIIHFPLVSCVGRRALLLERVVRSGIVSHCIMICLVDNLGLGTELHHSEIVLSVLHVNGSVQCICVCKPKTSPCAEVSLRVIFSSCCRCLGILSFHMAHAWHDEQGRGSLLGRDGPDLKPQDQSSACAGKESREGGRICLKSEKAWRQSLQPARQRCCVFLSSLNLTPVLWTLALIAGIRAVALASAISCPPFLVSGDRFGCLSPFKWKVTHKKHK